MFNKKIDLKITLPILEYVLVNKNNDNFYQINKIVPYRCQFLA